MRVIQLAAGAAGMYCGSCMHDNRLAAALRALGHDVTLLPLYTPLRTDEQNVSAPRVHYGGINVYLQQSLPFFRYTPWFFDRLLDATPLLNAVGKLAASTRAEDLGAMTVSVLRGEQGPQVKELDKLIVALQRHRPVLVQLPNLMFVGVARRLKAALNAVIVCELAGEDVFLDGLPEPFRHDAFTLIRQAADQVDGFVAVTDYYARHAAQHFGLPADRVHTIPMGILAADFARAAPPDQPFTIGFLAHICPPKGLANLAEAFIMLKQRVPDARLHVAGYVGPADEPYLTAVRSRLRQAGLSERDFALVGEVSRAQKRAFLQALHVFSVPTNYVESKGFYVLEALAAGVPVVQPRHGAFPELLEATDGGLLYEPGNTPALGDALVRLAQDPALRRTLAEHGRAAVQRDFSAERMARAAWALYERLVHNAAGA